MLGRTQRGRGTALEPALEGGEHRWPGHCAASGRTMTEEPNQGNAVPQGEPLGVARGADVWRERGNAGGDVGGGRVHDCRKRSVRCAEDGEELSEERRPAGVGQERGRPTRGGCVLHAKHAEPGRAKTRHHKVKAG